MLLVVLLIPLTSHAESPAVADGGPAASRLDEIARASWDVSGTSGSQSLITGDARLSRVDLASGETAACTKRIDFGAQSKALVCTFNLSLSVEASTPTVQIFRLGSEFTASTTDESDAATYARLGVRATANGSGFALIDPASDRQSMEFDGTQAVTWAVNTSSGPISYAAPDGRLETIAANHMDVWVGRNKVFDEARVTTPDAAVTDLKWLWIMGSGATTFSQLAVRKLERSDLAAAAAPFVEPMVATAAGDGVELYRPWPNPMSERVRYAYAIPGSSQRVDIGVFDVAGRSVRSLVHGMQSAGRYEVVWDGRNESGVRAHSGVYFLRAAVGAGARVSRIVLIE